MSAAASKKKRRPRLTPWFPGDVTPVRPGVYECKGIGAGAWFRHWDGRAWYSGDFSADDAAHAYAFHPVKVSKMRPRWRGLASNPAKRASKSRKSA